MTGGERSLFMKKQYRMQIFFGVVTLLLLLLAFTSATYA